ncbi:MAG: primase-helicase family protein [Leeuwenhoekiella sp.]
MSTYKYNLDTLSEATNGGLDILQKLVPEGDNGGSGKYRHFKYYEEDHGSSIYYCNPKGIYVIKHFGPSGDPTKSFSSIVDVIIDRTQAKDFYTALQWGYSTFGLGDGNNSFGGPDFEMKPATKGQKHGQQSYKYKQKFTDTELDYIGPLFTKDLAARFHLKPVKYKVTVKQYENHHKYDNKLMQVIIKSTENYFIYAIDCGDFRKIYQPFSRPRLDKDGNQKYSAQKWGYDGDKPEKHLYGLDYILEEFEPLPAFLDVNDKEQYKEICGEYGEKDTRADAIGICSGERDAFNIASLGYPTVYKNSETEPLSYDHYILLKERAKKLFYLGDNDATGYAETVKLALQYPDIHIIWLPKFVGYVDANGQPGRSAKPIKDSTDYAKAMWIYGKKNREYIINDFQARERGSVPIKFWDHVYDDKGNFKKYSISVKSLKQFYYVMGYRLLDVYGDKNKDFGFYQIRANVIYEVLQHNLLRIPEDFIERRFKAQKSLQEFVMKTPQINLSQTKKIAKVKFDFADHHSKNHQYFFFRNIIWKVTPDGVKTINYGKADTNVLENKVIDRVANYSKDKIFNITKENGRYDIEILAKDNEFLNYLINTSRVHWRKMGDDPYRKQVDELDIMDPDELAAAEAKIWEARDEYRAANRFNIAEDGLTDEEIYEQKLHLINKIFAWGYAMHRYKDPSKAWAGIAMDYKISDVGESNGRTGKSIFYEKAFTQMWPSYVYVDGRNTEKIKDKFLLQGVNEHTDGVVFDDLDSRFPYDTVFTMVTGIMSIRRMHRDNLNLTYSQSPKSFLTTNHGIFAPDNSTMSRLLISAWADYYHENKDDDRDTYKPIDDFGQNLFSDWDESGPEFSRFFNFSAQALQFQMTTKEKINPPMGNINKRNNLQTIGDAFDDWANEFFYSRLNRKYPKAEIFDEAKKKMKFNSPREFNRKLEGWCRIHGYKLNPKKVTNVLNTQDRPNWSYNGKTIPTIFIYDASPNAPWIDTDEVHEITWERQENEKPGDNSIVDDDDITDAVNGDENDDVPY